MLIRVFTTHYSEKDSHTALEGIWRCNSEAELLQKLPSTLWDSNGDDKWSTPDEDGYGGLTIYADKPRFPILTERAKALGLKIREPKESWETWYCIFGTKTEITLIWQGNSFEELEDLCYGAVQFDWEEWKRWYG